MKDEAGPLTFTVNRNVCKRLQLRIRQRVRVQRVRHWSVAYLTSDPFYYVNSLWSIVLTLLLLFF